MLTATGLGSGLDVNSLVTQLVASERAGSDLQLSREGAKLNSKFSALGTLQGSLANFQARFSSLNTLSNFSKSSGTSSNSSELSVTTDSGVIPNDYSVKVSQLATSHSLASPAVADTDTTLVGTGTLTIRFGTTDYIEGSDTYNSFTLNPESSVATITIDSSNNTLEGVMTSINDADIGISASIVNDGTGFRLLMTSDKTGDENSIEISVADDDTNNIDTDGLSQFAFNASATNITQTAASQDAIFSINGLGLSSASNSVKEAIPGVTLTLKEASDTLINVSVGADYSGIRAGINGFIAGYNGFVETANTLSSYDVENDIPSVLLGDFTLRSINSQVNSILRNAIPGLTGTIQNLSEIGVTTTSSGTLELDAEKLNTALEEHPDEVAQLFAAVGNPDDSKISFTGSGENTQVGNYAVEITALATSGSFTSAGGLPDFGGVGTLLINSDNDNLTFEVDGINTGEITLTAATYTTGHDLADEIQAQINGTTNMRDASRTVTVEYDSGSDSFSITSNTLGSSSSVNVLTVDTNTVAELGFSVSDGIGGIDVAGTIDGIVALGNGNTLTGSSGSGAEGLSLNIEGNTLGNRGNVNFTKGLANQLDSLFTQLLDDDGALETRIDSFKERIDEIEERKESLELRWEVVEERYRRQFNSLDILLAGLTSTSSYLEGQFENLLTPNTGN